MELIRSYVNGNYNVYLFDDGTKVRRADANVWKPAFAENIDIKITDRCTGAGCAFCHEGSGPIGEHGDVLSLKFFDTLHKGQEVALGGGNVFEHPDLVPLLKKLKAKGVVSNITVNQLHFFKYQELIEELIKEKLIWGLGISMVYPEHRLLALLKDPLFKNAVVHIINGVLTKWEVNKLKDNNIKLLILGYKHLRRGEDYFNKEKELVKGNQKWLSDNIMDLFKHFNTISFDNLALEQLDMKNKLDKEVWDECYMGDDGTTTYYIDCVNKQFAQSSTSPLDKRYPLLDNVDDMFNIIAKEKEQK